MVELPRERNAHVFQRLSGGCGFVVSCEAQVGRAARHLYIVQRAVLRARQFVELQLQGKLLNQRLQDTLRRISPFSLLLQQSQSGLLLRQICTNKVSR